MIRKYSKLLFIFAVMTSVLFSGSPAFAEGETAQKNKTKWPVARAEAYEDTKDVQNLRWHIREGKTELAREIINKKGYDVNKMYYIGGVSYATPLMHAVILERVDIVKILLDAKSNPHLQNNREKTAFTIAVTGFDDFEHLRDGKGDKDVNKAKQITRLLLAAGADPDLPQTLFGKNPLMEAATYSGKDKNFAKQVVEILLNEGKANPNIKDSSGDTALIIAAGKGYDGVVELLLKAKADPNIEGQNGTALQVTQSRLKITSSDSAEPYNRIISLLKEYKAKK